jgi:predicted Zn-dependent peptidase
MAVWLNEDHSQPKIFGAIVVKAGAKNSPNTGIAHYFEHMMFKGTDKIGTIDYAREKRLLDIIADLYDKLAQTADKKERTRLQEQINDYSVLAADFVIPNEFNRLISRYGGSGLDAGTSLDYTVYVNVFSPQYIAQWAEINSERLLNPVFRMFQSELETVYEEKNMYRDVLGREAMERFIGRFFQSHPYEYPIIGSTENLKNPRLSEMMKFFKTYYVASNMGVILSGDFETEEILPVLESTFSRIRKGKAPKGKATELPPFEGEEKFVVRLPIPLVKIAGFAFRGVPANHPDQAALNIVISLLNNANGTGYLDKLMVNRKLMAAMTINESFNDAGVLGIIGIPKLMFQSLSHAKELIWKEVERIKEGDFSDDMFSSLKLEQKRRYASRLEDISSRSEVMVELFSQGKSWEDYLKEVEHVDALTKDDVVHAARKYFTKNYLFATKKTGKYPTENLSKPNFRPLIPEHVDASSEYAEQLKSLPVKEVKPRFLDLENDVRIIPLSAFARLYVAPNPVNDIFTLDISFGVGKIERPELTQLASYLPLLGTKQLPFEVFRQRLQSLGSSLYFTVDDNRFVIKVTGFDAHFDETLALVASFMYAVKADNKKIKQLGDEEKVSKKAFFKSTDNIAGALLEKVRNGEQSYYLNKLSLSEIKKLKGADLLRVFGEIQRVACDFHYCGALPEGEVVGSIGGHIRLGDIAVASNAPIYRPLMEYGEPTVFFCDVHDASQSIVYAYVKGGDALGDEASPYVAKLFSGYFGNDMSSLMFQEIREFRSFAYRTKGGYSALPLIHRDKPGEFNAMLSTQADKTIDALTVMDSLIRRMPIKPERIPAVKQSLINQSGNEYPTFRKISRRIASLLLAGYTSDPNETLIDRLPRIGMDDVVRFYEENIQGRPVIYMIVGNSRKIDMNRLAGFGKIVKVKKEELYR